MMNGGVEVKGIVFFYYVCCLGIIFCLCEIGGFYDRVMGFLVYYVGRVEYQLVMYLEEYVVVGCFIVIGIQIDCIVMY